MTTLKRYWLAIFFVILGFAAAATTYGRLPRRIAVHWNIDGEPNGWMLKQRGAFVLPLTALVLLLLMIAVAPRAAREPRSGSFYRVYPTLVATSTALLLYMTIMILLIGTGIHLDVPAYASTGVGILFMILGNSLGKVTRNPVVGIRTPWTLADDEVWSRTHRLGGWLFVLAGLATTIAGPLGYGKFVGIATILAASLICVVYSYVIRTD